MRYLDSETVSGCTSQDRFLTYGEWNVGQTSQQRHANEGDRFG